MMSQNANQQLQHRLIQRTPIKNHHSQTMRSPSVILKEKEDEIFVSLKMILKVSHQLQYLATVTMPLSQRLVIRFSLQVIVMSSKSEESILIKNLEMTKLVFLCSVVQQVARWIITSYPYSLIINQILAVIIHVGTINIIYNASYEDIAWNVVRTFSDCKVTLLTIALFRQFQFKKFSFNSTYQRYK